MFLVFGDFEPRFSYKIVPIKKSVLIDTYTHIHTHSHTHRYTHKHTPTPTYAHTSLKMTRKDNKLGSSGEIYVAWVCCVLSLLSDGWMK